MNHEHSQLRANAGTIEDSIPNGAAAAAILAAGIGCAAVGVLSLAARRVGQDRQVIELLKPDRSAVRRDDSRDRHVACCLVWPEPLVGNSEGSRCQGQRAGVCTAGCGVFADLPAVHGPATGQVASS